jgi:transcriptional regulator with XRE-family HTH domain
MNQTNQIYDELKLLLKAAGLTYGDVARHLDVSNASVKRLFSEQTMSLQRIEAVAELLNMTLGEVVSSAESREEQINVLSAEQEQALVDDISLLIVGVCVTNRWSFDTILNHYTIDEHELIQLMVRLDKLGIIELLPGNRYRLRVSRNFRWRTNGPLQTFFFKTVLPDFFRVQQDEDKSYFRFLWGLSGASDMTEIRQRIDRLASEFVDVTEQVRSDEEVHGSSLLISFRQDWQPVEFRAAGRTE